MCYDAQRMKGDIIKTNRAVIAFEGADKDSTLTGVYLDIGGDIKTVEEILSYCHRRGHCAPDTDPEFAMTWLVYEAVNKFLSYTGASGMPVRVGPCNTLNCVNYDNGMYIIGDNWSIVNRLYYEK